MEKQMFIKVNGTKVPVYQYTPKGGFPENSGWKGGGDGEDGFHYSIKIYPASGGEVRGTKKAVKEDSALLKKMEAMQAEIAALKAPKKNGKAKPSLVSVEDGE